MELVPNHHRGFVLAVSAPSGTGKTSLCDKLALEIPGVVRSISITTRPQRDGEVSGRDYTFVSVEEFKKREAAGELLETAEVFGNWYGTPRTPVLEAIRRGEVIVMDIDTVGALAIHQKMPEDTALVYVFPPSFEELEKRLRARGKNKPEELARRFQEASREIRESKAYHYFIPNVSFDRAYEDLKAVLQVEKLKSHRNSIPFLEKA